MNPQKPNLVFTPKKKPTLIFTPKAQGPKMNPRTIALNNAKNKTV